MRTHDSNPSLTTSRYEFLFRASRFTFWLGICGAFYSLAIGLSAIGGVVADRLLRAPRLDAAEIAVGVLGGLALVGISLSVLRRTFLQAYDCRIGKAGIYFRTMTRQQGFIEWTSFAGFQISGGTVRLSYDDAGGKRRIVWLEMPRRCGSNELRLRTFLDGRLRARAALAFAHAEPAASEPEVAA